MTSKPANSNLEKWRTTLYYITYVVKKRSRVCSSGLVWHPTVLYGLLLVVCVSLLFPLDPALHSPLHTRYICCAIVGLAVKRSSFLLFQAYCASLPAYPPACMPACPAGRAHSCAFPVAPKAACLPACPTGRPAHFTCRQAGLLALMP